LKELTNAQFPNSQFPSVKTARVSAAAVPRMGIQNWELSIGQILGVNLDDPYKQPVNVT